jgi:cell division protein ZapE
MILGRLFEALFAAGVVVVSTSNWPPDQLYKNGLQRERFLPFIDLIQTRMQVYHLQGAVDHRYEQTKGLPSFFHPLNDENTRRLQEIFFRLTGDAEPEPITLPVQGRSLRITHAAKGVGFFNFDELCVAALGAADYLAIAESLHTVIIDGVPRMLAEQRNITMRFVNLIDALYDARVKIYLAAAAAPADLAPPGELNFQFQRTLSRLVEMQSEEYRKQAHLGE